MARENASLVYIHGGQPHLIVAGGNPLISGQQPFETYKVHLDSFKWERLNVPKNISIPLGSKPELVVDQATTNVHYLIYSGQ